MHLFRTVTPLFIPHTCTCDVPSTLCGDDLCKFTLSKWFVSSTTSWSYPAFISIGKGGWWRSRDKTSLLSINSSVQGSETEKKKNELTKLLPANGTKPFRVPFLCMKVGFSAYSLQSGNLQNSFWTSAASRAAMGKLSVRCEFVEGSSNKFWECAGDWMEMHGTTNFAF